MRRQEGFYKGHAIITGASSGIGQEFAWQLARAGCNVTLVARRTGRLVSLAADLKERYDIKAVAFQADLTQADDVQALIEHMAGVDKLAYLINAAGFGIEQPFAACDITCELNMINLHVVAPVCLSRAALPYMLQAGEGGIVNLSSLGAFAPLPGYVGYAGTKSYILAWSRSVALELQGTSVHMQALCPGFVPTEFQEKEGTDFSWVPKFAWMTTEDLVAASLRDLHRGQAVSVPGFFNRVIRRLSGPFGWAFMRRMARKQPLWHVNPADWQGQLASGGSAPTDEERI